MIFCTYFIYYLNGHIRGLNKGLSIVIGFYLKSKEPKFRLFKKKKICCFPSLFLILFVVVEQLIIDIYGKQYLIDINKYHLINTAIDGRAPEFGNRDPDHEASGKYLHDEYECKYEFYVVKIDRGLASSHLASSLTCVHIKCELKTNL